MSHSILPAFALLVLTGIASAEKERVLRSGSELDYPPLAIVTEEGDHAGFSVDLLRAVAERVHLEVEIQVSPWEELRHGLEQGELDLLPLVGYSEERDVPFDFTVPYLRINGGIFVPKGNHDIRSTDDLKGKQSLNKSYRTGKVMFMHSGSSKIFAEWNGLG